MDISFCSFTNIVYNVSVVLITPRNQILREHKGGPQISGAGSQNPFQVPVRVHLERRRFDIGLPPIRSPTADVETRWQYAPKRTRVRLAGPTPTQETVRRGFRFSPTYRLSIYRNTVRLRRTGNTRTHSFPYRLLPTHNRHYPILIRASLIFGNNTNITVTYLYAYSVHVLW